MQQHPAIREKRLPAAGWHWTATLLVAALLLISSCATLADQTLVYQTLNRNEYGKAVQIIESNVQDYYGKTDEVLYLLDTGVISHYAGMYTESNEKFSMAEKLIDEFYATSISQDIGSWMVNDLVKDYAGEDFEDIYGNIFMALNYIQLGMTEDAFVEIRRFDNKQRLLQTKYAEALNYSSNELKKKNAEIPAVSSQFNNSALARYISMILYRSEGNLDNAAVDRKMITQAFNTQVNLYPFQEPAAILDEELAIPKGKARLNILSFSGLSPDKYEQRISIGDLDDDYHFVMAYPAMRPRRSAVAAVRATVTAEDGTQYTVPLYKIESIESIAMDTFSRKEALIFARAFIRGTGKAIVSKSLTSEDSKGLNLFLSLVQEISEQADIRTTRYFPGSVQVTGLTLDPGIYTVAIEYLNSRGDVFKTDVHEEVAVRAKGINLTESLCLQ